MSQLLQQIYDSQVLEQHVTQLQQQLQHARAEAAELQQHVDTHQAQLYASNSSIAQLQAAATEAQAELAAAQSKAGALQSQLAAAQLSCSEARSQLAQEALRSADSEEEAERHQAQFAASEIRCSELQSQLTEAAAKHAAAEQRCTDLMQEAEPRSQATASQQQQQQLLLTAQSQLADVKSQLDDALLRCSELKAQQAAFKRQSEAANAELSVSEQRYAEMHADEQEEEGDGAVGAIVDKLWQKLQLERVSKILMLVVNAAL